MNEKHVSKKELIAHLRGLGNGTIEPACIYFGICHDLDQRFDLWALNTSRWWRSALEDWPKCRRNEFGSRSMILPVPCERARGYAFYMHSPGGMWGDNQYGNDRRELCRHLADWLENNPTTTRFKDE